MFFLEFVVVLLFLKRECRSLGQRYQMLIFKVLFSFFSKIQYEFFVIEVSLHRMMISVSSSHLFV